MRWMAPLSLGASVLTLVLVVGLFARQPAQPSQPDLSAVTDAIRALRTDLSRLPAPTADPDVAFRLENIERGVEALADADNADDIRDALGLICARLDDLRSDLVGSPPGGLNIPGAIC